MSTRLYYSSAFIGILAVFQARGCFIGALPFSSTFGTSGFVFVAPDFKVSIANMAFDVSGFRLQHIT